MVLSMERWVGKVAIVTGASAGIGAAIAENLVEAGLFVVGLARSSERIDENAKKLSSKKGKLYSFKADCTVEDDILKAFEWTSKTLGPVHVLINNAGVFRMTSLMEGNTKSWLEVFNTNVIGLCIATREAVKIMKNNNIQGHIIHINSIAGHKVPYVPNQGNINVYAASKHAVTALTETLRQELNNNKLKIKITSISPGFVDSEIIIRAYSDKAKGHEHYEKLKQVQAYLHGEDVADAVNYALSTAPHVQVHELTIKPIGERF